MITTTPPPQATTGTVVGRTGTTYQVRTGAGRTITAESATLYAIGDPVTVLAGQIIGRAGRPQPSIIYEV